MANDAQAHWQRAHTGADGGHLLASRPQKSEGSAPEFEACRVVVSGARGYNHLMS